MKKILMFILTISNYTFAQYNPNLYILEGQSNAAGACVIANLPSDLAGPLIGVQIFNTTSLTWETMEGGVNNSALSYGHQGDGVRAFGVELRLMKLLHSSYGIDQYLIKYALGGTGLAQNSGGTGDLNWHPFMRNLLYDQSNTNFNTAISALNDKRPPRAFIWIQGEQDAYYSADAANAYQTNLQNFIAAKRAFYGYERMPFIIVRLGDQQSNLYTYKATVRAAEAAVAAQPNNFLVSADGLVTSDGSHYMAAGYDSIANRLYRTILSLDAKITTLPPISTDPPITPNPPTSIDLTTPILFKGRKAVIN